MDANTLTERSVTVERPRNQRSRVSNRPQRMVVSARTAAGRRLRDLADAYAQVLGGWAGLSDVQAANVRKAAELTALAEQARADALRNGCNDPAALTRLEHLADKAVRRLGVDKRREPERGPDLKTYLDSLAKPKDTA
jgi:hypothetical protein